MDVDWEAFPSKLLDVMNAISEADFVSFDLEMTGIPSHLPGKQPRKPQNVGRSSLEERYQETKQAAGRYHILQVGITCACFDHSSKKYVLRPYNFSLSPLLHPESKLDIYREIHISSDAATFLVKHGFDFDAAFARGVHYLSREEAGRALRMLIDRQEKTDEVPDVQLKKTEVQSLDFVRRARQAITAWQGGSTDYPLEITTHTGLSDQPQYPIISPFEKRLVHQLVRADFPGLTSRGLTDCMRVAIYDSESEKEQNRRIKNRVKENIAIQTGFRWVVEALADDGRITEVDPSHFGPRSKVTGQILDAENAQSRFDRMHARLEKGRPVLVGHNMFIDLVYLYRSFIGPLPDTLAGFCEDIHHIFPKLVDTKFLATHDAGDLPKNPSLQDISNELRDQPLPDIIIHADHSKYDDTATTAFHEAGYDSLQTATIMLRLSAKMEHNKEHEKPVHPQPHDESDKTSDSEESFKTTMTDFELEFATLCKSRGPTSPPHDVAECAGQAKGKKKRKPRQKGKTSGAASRFQTRNMYESLSEDFVQDAAPAPAPAPPPSPPPSPSFEEEDQIQASAAAPSWRDEVELPDAQGLVPIETREREPMEKIPGWDSGFWGRFGNTLRVFGTEEKVLGLGKWGK